MIRSACLSPRLGRSAIAIALLPSLLLVRDEMHGQEPTIVARFTVEAPLIPSRLGDPGLVPGVEDSVSAVLANQGERHFPYLDWVAGSATDSGNRPRLSVVARQLDIDTGGPTPCQKIVLTFLAVRTDGTIQLAEETLYPVCIAPPDDLDDLLRDLHDAIVGRFGNEPFRQSVQSVLLSKIALTDRFMLDKVKRGVVIPLQWRELSADPDSSEFTLLFVVLHEDDQQLDAEAQLEKPTEITQTEIEERADAEVSGWRGFVRLSPRFFKITDLVELNTGIVNALDSLRARNALEKVQAFMLTYRPMTLGGLSDCMEGMDCGGGQ